MDLVMPKKDGIEATKEIIRKEPDSSILVITGFSEKAHAIPAIQAGARGFILKDTSPEEMLRAIREVDRGNLWLSPEIKRMLMRKTASPKPSARFTDAPTERELDVLKLICLGNSDEDIAEELVISKATVRFHVTNILSKLQVKNRTQAALYAIKEGYCKDQNLDFPGY
jgi:NarL family two-component system response regulator LiaR